MNSIDLRRVHLRLVAATFATLLALLGGGWIARAQGSLPVTWIGGNLLKRWNDPANWDKGVVPLNGGGITYTVMVPPNSSITYDSGGTGAIGALSFGDNSVLDIVDGNSLEVIGVGLINGKVQTDGPGSGFRAQGSQVVLNAHPRLLASNGSHIAASSSTFDWSRLDANADLLWADTGSPIDLSKVSSFQMAFGFGARTYTLRASESGVIDLSGLGTLNGPGDDDWLNVNLNTGGNIRLDSLQQVGGRVRFNIRVPTYELPLLQRVGDTAFLLGSNVTFTVPQLLRASSSEFSVGANSIVTLPSLLTLQTGALALEAGSQFLSDSLQSVSDASITVGEGGMVDLPGLISLDTVPITLIGNGAFIATNLVAYRNSDIPIRPGRDMRLGTLTDVDASRVSVTGGMEFRVSAPS